MNTLVPVPCRLCGASPEESAERYVRAQDALAPLGRFEVRLAQCATCGLLQVSPRPSAAALARHYAEAASASGDVYRETGAGSRHAQLAARRVGFVRAAIERFGAPGCVRLLEVGCGRGDLLGALAPAGWRSVGLEPAPAAAELARAAGHLVVQEPLETTTLPAGAFDAVVAFSVLEHLDDPARAVERLATLAARDGVIVVEVPDACHPFTGIAEFFSFEHLTHFTPHTLARFFAAHGFGLVALERDEERAGLAAVFRRGPSTVRTPDDRAELARAIARYRDDRAARERKIVQRLTPLIARWRSAEERVAVYGAGAHTRFLFDLVPLRAVAYCLLDGDERKQGTELFGLPVHAPEACGALELTAVVLSSRAFEDEMAARLAEFARDGGEVVRLYG